jgi:hypothetical protein
MEDSRFTGPFIGLLKEEEERLHEMLYRSEMQRDSDVVRGEIKKLRWFVGLHDECLGELQRRRESGDFEPKEVETSEDA